MSGYRYLGNSGTDRRKLSHDDTYESWIRLDVSSPPPPRGSPNRNFEPKFGPFDGEYLENGKSQHYMLITVRRELSIDLNAVESASGVTKGVFIATQLN